MTISFSSDLQEYITNEIIITHDRTILSSEHKELVDDQQQK